MSFICKLYNKANELVEKTLHSTEKDALDWAGDHIRWAKKDGSILTAVIHEYTEEMAMDDIYLALGLLSLG